MNIVVVGGGSWGTTFARLLFDHGHEVTLACRDPEQAAAIRETRRNPRYMADVHLTGIAAAAIPDAPVEDANLVEVWVASHDCERARAVLQEKDGKMRLW